MIEIGKRKKNEKNIEKQTKFFFSKVSFQSSLDWLEQFR